MSAKDLLTSVVAGAAAMREAMVDISESAGAAPIHAAIVQGGEEFAQALRAFPESISASPQPGGVGTILPQEVMDARNAEMDEPEMG